MLTAALRACFAPLTGYSHIGLAVSGGADSLALMLVTHQWAAERTPAPRLTVYSVDHGLRPEAAEEVAFVLAEAKKLGLAARDLHWRGEKPQSGLQAAAREARYRLIGAAMREDGAEVLATAHHMRDQAETVLMRLAHGSGIGGLGGMAALGVVDEIAVVRPLLDIDPETLRAIVADAGLTPVEDPSNTDSDYERVRWRELLPGLAEHGLTSERLVQFARRQRRADEVLSSLAEAAFVSVSRVDGFGAVGLDRANFSNLPEETGIRVVQCALRLAGGGQRPYALGAVEKLYEQLFEEHFPGKSLSGCVVRQSGANLVFAREAGRIGVAEAMLAPGQSMVWDGRFRIEVPADGENVTIRAANGLVREEVERLLGRPFDAPMSIVAAAPLVRTLQGRILAIGTHIVDEAARLSSSVVGPVTGT